MDGKLLERSGEIMSIEISLCLAVWNTSHLLRRSVQIYLYQDIDPERWEIIVIDDNSQDNVQEAIKPLMGKVNLRYERLEHSYGMRGNTVSFNTAFRMARGHILAETTPESMLPRDGIRNLLDAHTGNPRCFVALKTYNMTKEMQRIIDTVDWKSDLINISKLPGWDSPWCQHNVPIKHFGTHMICSIRKNVFFEITDGRGFPLFGGYGEEDPWYAGTRQQKGVQDITLPNTCMGIHQWHVSFQYWMAKGRAPHLNRFAHTMSNYLNDTSGHVPQGGTCMIWDGGSHEQMSDAEKAQWATLDADALATGVPPEIM
jgi:hypothetical protein